VARIGVESPVSTIFPGSFADLGTRGPGEKRAPSSSQFPWLDTLTIHGITDDWKFNKANTGNRSHETARHPDEARGCFGGMMMRTSSDPVMVALVMEWS
jgi:hypothetical protein